MQMILGLRNGDNKFKGFQSLLKNFFVTPVTVLAEQCKQRGVTVSYRVKSVRKATSIHPTTYLVEAILDGEWVEYVNGSLRQTKEKRSFEGLGISTRDGRAKAAAFALRKLKEFVPGIKYEPWDDAHPWCWACLDVLLTVVALQICGRRDPRRVDGVVGAEPGPRCRPERVP